MPLLPAVCGFSWVRLAGSGGCGFRLSFHLQPCDSKVALRGGGALVSPLEAAGSWRCRALYRRKAGECRLGARSCHHQKPVRILLFSFAGAHTGQQASHDDPALANGSRLCWVLTGMQCKRSLWAWAPYILILGLPLPQHTETKQKHPDLL